MTEERERRINQTTDLLNTWASIGVWARMVLVSGALGGFLWLLLG